MTSVTLLCLWLSNSFVIFFFGSGESGAGRIKSLRDPSKKMSKSDKDNKSRIEITDSADEIIKKIKRAVTDFESKVYYDADNRPGVSNLIGIHSLISDKTHEQIAQEYSNLDTGK